MNLISDFIRDLKLVCRTNEYGLYEYTPKLLSPLIVPFENLSLIRRIRFFLEYLRGGYRVYYLSVGEIIVGYNVVTPGGRRLKISTHKDIVIGPLYIAPDFRRKGYSTVLMKLTLEYCAYSYENAYDWIEKNNVPSIRTSLSCGFKECAHLNVIGICRKLVLAEDGNDIVFCYKK